jgi:hypothetical protein
MTGPEHFAEAERIVLGERCDYGCPHGGCAHEMAYLARAQVHALLALTAATALPGQHPGDWEREIWSFGPETLPGPGEHHPAPGPGGEDGTSGSRRLP